MAALVFLAERCIPVTVSEHEDAYGTQSYDLFFEGSSELVYRAQWNSASDWGQLAFYFSDTWKCAYISGLTGGRDIARVMIEKVFGTGKYLELSTGETEWILPENWRR